VLAEKFYSPDDVAGIASGTYPLEAVDAGVMEFAAKVAQDASSVTQADVDRLRELGLSDEEVVDVALTAALRSFFTKTLDALGTEPDASFRELDPVLRDRLTVGRAIADD